MPVFAVQYTYGNDIEKIEKFRPEHVDFLSELHATGTLLVSGPWSVPNTGALLLIKAEDVDAAKGIMDQDPFARENIVAERSINQWNVFFGFLPGADVE
ncbi:YciI family protein [Micrococcoides hystricis]|uniref:YciI family protein n=1 Tax=Micrococcoides hystricis TaxID=1572761 RepID=A0ABV6PCG1_9MICC